MQNKYAFTLIELLVVVLIIGILSTVALPQYRIAVEKSRITQVVSVLRTIYNAQTVYYLANGNYTKDISELDVDIAPTTGWTIELSSSYDKVVAHRDNMNMDIDLYFTGTQKGRLFCAARTGTANSLAQKICRVAGRESAGDDTYWVRYYLD